MTPDTNSGEVSMEATAKEYGFDTVEAMVAAAKKGKARDAYDGRQSGKIRDLEAQIRELQSQQQEADLGIGEDADETSRRLAREILQLKSTVSALTTKLATKPEDEELEPFFDQVLDEFPEVKTVKDPIRRMEMARRLARQLKAESDNPAENKGRDLSDAHFTGGGSPVSGRSQIDEDQANERYARELAKARTPAEKESVNAKYRAKYPHWGL